MHYTSVILYVSLPAMQTLRDCVQIATPKAKYFGDRVASIKDVSPKQFAIVGLGASAHSLFFGVLPLLQAGLLVPAAVIIRALLERVATISWLSKGAGDTYKVFSEQWNDWNKRPSLEKRIRTLDNYIGDNLPPDNSQFVISDHIVKDWLELLHSDTHGDYQHSNRNAVHENGFSNFAAGPDPFHPDSCSRLAELSVQLFGQLHHELELAVPELRQEPK